MKINLINLLLLSATLVALTTSCKKDEKKEEPTPDNNAITSQLYFQATIDGTVVTFQESVNGYASAPYYSSDGEDFGCQIGQGTMLSHYMENNNKAGFIIYKSFGVSDSQVTHEQIDNITHTGSYPFKVNNQYNSSEGVEIFYKDNEGVYWTTLSDPGNQTGSLFTITEHIVSASGYSHNISKATFNCKLYDASGRSKTLTNGVCRSRTVIYYY